MENKVFKKRLPIVSLLLREKKFLINPDFQIQFMLSLAIISILSMSIIYIANDYFFQSYLAKGQALNLPPDHPFFLMIHEQKKFMAKVFITVAASITTIVALWGLFFSHKIAGPLFRLNQYFKKATEKRELQDKIYFREDDFFHEIPAAINQYVDTANDQKLKVNKDNKVA